jgi:hypothetical protein
VVAKHLQNALGAGAAAALVPSLYDSSQAGLPAVYARQPASLAGSCAGTVNTALVCIPLPHQPCLHGTRVSPFFSPGFREHLLMAPAAPFAHLPVPTAQQVGRWQVHFRSRAWRGGQRW